MKHEALDSVVGKNAVAVPLVPITVAYGDGIGPEIMAATLAILNAAGARIAPETIEVGEAVYQRGVSAGIEDASWASLRRTRVLLKAPITTPSGGGYKSLNVTIRKTLGLFANVRPCVSYDPFVPSRAGAMDMVIVRENEEDLYAGIEHRHTDEVVQCLKLISRPGCERIVRYAFEYARAHGRRKVTCMIKDNIMKMSDGLFYSVFEEIGAEYPEIIKERAIIDIGAARIATRPGDYDVVVAPNLYGDIISDIAAEVAGSVGLAGSANIGEHIAMFEAIHGSAPDISGRDIANPSGLLMGAILMLKHIGQPQVAERIYNAWACVIEEGLHTADIKGAMTTEVLGTREFAAAVIARLGSRPQRLKPAPSGESSAAVRPSLQPATLALPFKRKRAQKLLVGTDIFVHASGVSPDVLGRQVLSTLPGEYKLSMITNRGVKVWPNGFPETFCTDHWRCRIEPVTLTEGQAMPAADVAMLLKALVDGHLEVIKTENLYTFDGERGYALGQGQ
jgi:isocitrate dehydrogenase